MLDIETVIEIRYSIDYLGYVAAVTNGPYTGTMAIGETIDSALYLLKENLDESGVRLEDSKTMTTASSSSYKPATVAIQPSLKEYIWAPYSYIITTAGGGGGGSGAGITSNDANSINIDKGTAKKGRLQKALDEERKQGGSVREWADD